MLASTAPCTDDRRLEIGGLKAAICERQVKLTTLGIESCVRCLFEKIFILLRQHIICRGTMAHRLIRVLSNGKGWK